MKLLRELQSIVADKTKYADRDEWMDAVKKAYPDKADKIKFKGGVEDGKHMFWAHIPGEDRSYGVYDMDSEEGEVLGESAITEAGGKSGTGGLGRRRGGPFPISLHDIQKDIPHELLSDDEVNKQMSDHEFADELHPADAVFFMNIFNKKERIRAKRDQLKGNRFKYAFYEVFDTLHSSLRAKLEMIEQLDSGRMNWENLERLVKSENKNILRRNFAEI